MEVKNRQKVRQTKSGLFVREDKGLGLLVYSPYSGLVFACQENNRSSVLNWLDKKTQHAPSSEFEKALGSGWAIEQEDAEYHIPQIIPHNSKAWPAQYPIIINWFLTGNCPLSCKYCYAEDLMRGRCREPVEKDIERIAETIISYNPLVVVLTGGDPLVSPYLAEAIKLLHKRTGIIVDTSAYTFNSKHLALFKKYKVFARISLDSEFPRVNNELRPLYSKHKGLDDTVTTAVNAVCKCIKNKVKIAVQTVATNRNHSYLKELGNKLFKLGVRSWRILMITKSKRNIEQFEKLKFKNKQPARVRDYIIKEIYTAHETQWQKKMAVQVVSSENPNAVILVAPNGVFYTQLKEPWGKVILDDKNPDRPKLDAVFSKVNKYTHTGRYLNIE